MEAPWWSIWSFSADRSCCWWHDWRVKENSTTNPWPHPDSCIPIQISRKSEKLAPRYSWLPIFNMASDCHLECKISIVHQLTVRGMEIHMHIKFDRDRMIRVWDMEIKLFSKWPPSAILNFRKLTFLSRDQLAFCDSSSPIQVSTTIWNLQNFDFCQITILGMEILIPNWIEMIHGWDMKIKLVVFKMAAVLCAILNLRKLQFWSRDLYRHAILHFCSKFCVDRPIWRRDITKKRFPIWRPSTILNLQNFDFCQTSMLGMEICICLPNLIEIG